MDKFITFSGLVAPLDKRDVDTDQIIPKQFLKLTSREGYGRFLFYHWRYTAEGAPRPDFLLNQDPYDHATILLARDNFGCGSSREHAAWAVGDFGFRVLIAPSFADIFKNNAFNNGLLPIELQSELIDEWFKRAQADKRYAITVDLEAQTLVGSDGFACSFGIDPARRQNLLAGTDAIGQTMEQAEAIAAYEETHPEPWGAGAPKEAS